MRPSEIKDRKRLMQAALGKIPCDLTLFHLLLVNVITGEIYPAQVDVLDGVIVRVRAEGEAAPLPARERFDCGGRYLLPGYIDCHTHVESSMMTPENLARAIVPWGTTTICTDPHEIANVMGEAGVDFMLQNAQRAALRQYVLAPSCVPSVPGLESAGAEFMPAQIGRLLDQDQVIGVAEMMDYQGVVEDSEKMRGIAEEGRKRRVLLQGHLPHPSSELLSAYLIGGPRTDHESTAAEEVLEKLRQGMRINLRASSIADQLDTLTEGLKSAKFLDQVSLCTDDVHAKDLLERGHINAIVARLIRSGMDALQAIRLCTWHAAKEYGFDDLGAIAPGYLADMQLTAALDGGRPDIVWIKGAIVAADGQYTAPSSQNPPRFPAPVFRVGNLSASDFLIPVPFAGEQAQVLVLEKGPYKGTKAGKWQTLPVKNGYVSIEDDPSLYYAAVFNRYGTGGRTVVVSREFGLKEGAIASTVSHDCHNFVLLYRDPNSALLCLEALRKTGGGMCAVQNGRIEALLPLPIAGLMSSERCEKVAAQIEQMEAAMQSLCREPISLLDVAIGSLAAIPGLVVTDCGLADTIQKTFVPFIRQP